MEKLLEAYKKLKDAVDQIELDVIKFTEKKNNAAGSRVRKQMQDIKKSAQEVRTLVQDLKKQPEA